MSTDTPKIPHYNQLIIYIDRHQGGEDRSFLRALSIDYRFFGVNANILAAMEQVPQLGVGGMNEEGEHTNHHIRSQRRRCIWKWRGMGFGTKSNIIIIKIIFSTA